MLKMIRMIFTKHARQRMHERNVSYEEIEEVLNFPDYSIAKGNKLEVYKEVDGRYLKIVYSQMSKFIKIITVILK